MTVITVRMGEGLPLEIKRRLVAQLTATASDVLGERPDSVTVLIEEISRENWSVGGVLRVDTPGAQDEVARRQLEAFFKKPSPTPEKAPPAKARPRTTPAKSQRRR
jgi:4-oxalocrotonate tautomerase